MNTFIVGSIIVGVLAVLFLMENIHEWINKLSDSVEKKNIKDIPVPHFLKKDTEFYRLFPWPQSYKTLEK